MTPPTDRGADVQLHARTLRIQMALGWVTILLVTSMDLSFSIIRSLLTEADRRFRSLRFDPGMDGMEILVWFIAFYALMPLYITLADAVRTSYLRWLAVVLAAGEVLFMGFHHWGHWISGERPTLSSHVLDVAIHLLGLWVLVNTVRWARLRREPAPIPQPFAPPRAQQRSDAHATSDA